MAGSRLLLVLLVTVAVALVAELYVSADGYQKTVKLQVAVAEQRSLNDALRSRNAALDAEVLNLKHGRDAAEERARADLGMIGREETFYQVVPVASANW